MRNGSDSTYDKTGFEFHKFSVCSTQFSVAIANKRLNFRFVHSFIAGSYDQDSCIVRFAFKNDTFGDLTQFNT